MPNDPTDAAEIALINLSFALAELSFPPLGADALDRVRDHISQAIGELTSLAPGFSQAPPRAAEAA